MKLVLSGSIVAGKKYRLTTFALPPERIQLYRDAYIEDESGEVVGRLTALWVLISAPQSPHHADGRPEEAAWNHWQRR